jgi:uncharacterized protein (TIGR02186 family)
VRSHLAAALFGLAGLAAAPALAKAPSPQPQTQRTTGCPTIVSEVLDGVIEVDASFRGARVTVYGAIQNSTMRRARVGDVVVTLRGPDQRVEVHRKRQVFGVWMPIQTAVFAAAPSYFAVAASKPLSEITTPAAIWSENLDPAPLARLAGPTPADTDPGAFRNALVRLKRGEGLYVSQSLNMSAQALFRASFELPAHAPVGRYEASVFLFCGQQMLQAQRGAVMVERTGMERAVYSFAHEQPILHGLIAVAMALAAGAASALLYRRK